MINEFRILAAPGHQFGIVTLLHHLTVFEHDHLIGVADGRQPVGNHKGRAALHQIGKALLHQLRGDISDHFSPHQLGVGVPNGAEAIVRSTTAWHEMNKDKAIVLIDFKNAFNRMCRSAMFTALMQSPQLSGLVPFVRLFYRDQPQLWLKSEKRSVTAAPTPTAAKSRDRVLMNAAPSPP